MLMSNRQFNLLVEKFKEHLFNPEEQTDREASQNCSRSSFEHLGIVKVVMSKEVCSSGQTVQGRMGHAY